MSTPAAATPKPAPKSPPKTPPKSPPKTKSPPSGKGAGRPSKPIIQKIPSGFKTAATGETRNSPMTDPNIIFWLGISLIIAAGWSSGRLPNLWKFASAPTPSTASDFANAIKSSFVQLIFVFILAISARAVPPLASIWLILLIGLWVMWLIKNPSFIKTLTGWAKSA